MDKLKILIQLDTDPLPSAFDRVVAVDAGADHVFSYGGVTPDNVMGLVHGAIFTRHPKDLKRTAIFIGGADVVAGERLLDAVKQHLLPKFGLQVSILLDSNGSNTTAAAAVRAASTHLNLSDTQALVLGGTGPVGQRVARLLAGQGANVRVGSRQLSRAQAVCQAIRAALPDAQVEPVVTATSADGPAALAGRQLVIAAGAAGTVLLPYKQRVNCPGLRMAIDLNAVPPVGIEGVEITDKAVVRETVLCYGALGVGDTKMKIHKAAVAKLFESNDQVLDAEQVYAIGETV
jgi:methylenetetrahydrofolate/methylenetetrahydromethanopterin dehydrogenase (NADP+)